MIEIRVQDILNEDTTNTERNLHQVEQLCTEINTATSLNILGDEEITWGEAPINPTLLIFEAAIEVDLDYPSSFAKLLPDILQTGADRQMFPIHGMEHLGEEVYRVILKEWVVTNIVRHQVNVIINDFTDRFSPLESTSGKGDDS